MQNDTGEAKPAWDGEDRRRAAGVPKDSTLDSFMEYVVSQLKSLDAQIKAMHIDTVNTRQELHIVRTEVEAIQRAFPKDHEGSRDYDGHYHYHGRLIEASRTWKEIRQDAAKKIFTSITWALLVLFAYSVWEYFKKQVKE